MTFLLDANVLIAYVFGEHSHHQAAMAWRAVNPSFAVCPFTEGALLRYALRASPAIRELAAKSLSSLKEMPGYSFWPADISHAKIQFNKVFGPNQVTDSYLVALATKNEARLATFDEALAADHPGAQLIPFVG